MVALVGAAVVGPRIGRFDGGAPVLLAGHTVPVRELSSSHILGKYSIFGLSVL